MTGNIDYYYLALFVKNLILLNCLTNKNCLTNLCWKWLIPLSLKIGMAAH